MPRNPLAMKPVPRDVDEYIENAPLGSRGKLRELRAAIREIAPDAEEHISYGMPCYGDKGRMVYFGIAKAHIGLYGMSSQVIEKYREEVGPYLALKGTIRLPLDREFPLELIKRLIRARMEEG